MNVIRVARRKREPAAQGAARRVAGDAARVYAVQGLGGQGRDEACVEGRHGEDRPVQEDERVGRVHHAHDGGCSWLI